MRRLVAIYTAGALLLSPFAASGVSASDGDGARPTDAGTCGGSSATIFIQLDRFADESYYESSGFKVLWKPYYWAAEGQTATFRIARVSDDCDDQVAKAWYAAENGTAIEGQDFTLADGETRQLYDPIHGVGSGPYYQDITFPVHADGLAEAVVEKAFVKLTRYDNAFGGEHTRAPFYFIDNQTSEFAFAEPAYSHSEFGPTMPVPVFRGGPADSSQTVNFSVEGTGANPAVEGENFEVDEPKTVTFAAGERVKVIDFSIINNQEPDGDRTFKISLEGQSAQNETEITLIDAGGDPPVKPRSRFHHPRQGWKYKRSDFRIREIHTFAFDEGGPEIAWAEFGLRKKMRNGSCSWWTGSRFKGGKCTAKKWLDMKRFGDFAGKLLYIYNLKKRLGPTQGTRIKKYRGFTRVGNIAGARESKLEKGRNVSNFKVKP
ncbi:MAG: Calx-beta domain-containing protein [Actinomycetota bacterium]